MAPTKAKQHSRKKTSQKIEASDNAVLMGLNAAIVAMRDDTPQVVIVKYTDPSTYTNDSDYGLPSGPFEPIRHPTLEIGLRSWVEEQTDLQLGYVEQLYTFGDRARFVEQNDSNRLISIGYLALTSEAVSRPAENSFWRSWYTYFPWEDWRLGAPALITEVIGPKLNHWAQDAESELAQERQDRIHLCFGLNSEVWDEEKVLERYELLYEAGLVFEAVRDRNLKPQEDIPELGSPMRFDNRRILATAMGRLRGKLKYRPVVFELMPETFTLLGLQKTVEAISGRQLHKQNFRRLVESSGLVESTGTVSTQTGGRPAQLFRFRKEVLRERPAPGVRVSSPRIAKR
jgi:hypothetical protein